MLKENDGTDSALEWEEFGASGIGDSGNMGVGEVAATLSIYTGGRRAAPRVPDPLAPTSQQYGVA